jgi:hypothetical protein
MESLIETTPAKDLFRATLRASFNDLDIADHGTVDYLAELLARFAATLSSRPPVTSNG